MKVIRTMDLINTERDVRGNGFVSLRVLLSGDNMGFSLHKTVIPKGKPEHWHYIHHLEACYCVSGRGELVNLLTKQKFEILPDTVYVLDEHDDHTFQALEDTVLISIFNPPVVGDEIHDENGYYQIEKPQYSNNLWE